MEELGGIKASDSFEVASPRASVLRSIRLRWVQVKSGGHQLHSRINWSDGKRVTTVSAFVTVGFLERVATVSALLTVGFLEALVPLWDRFVRHEKEFRLELHAPESGPERVGEAAARLAMVELQ